ncbi:MAG: hypothetical protein FJZ15_05915, partial [Candidatus Omnitrophica bacterium]|nr:hypothetical protein [Candidatus Omnitrophota bacterium]
GIPGAFKTAMEGAQYCIKNKIRTIMSIYSTPADILKGDTEKLISLAKEKSFHSVRLLGQFRIGKLAGLNKPDYGKEVMDRIKIISADKNFVKPHGIWNCFVPHKTTVYISPSGDVQPCAMVPFVFGNIKNRHLEEIIKEMRKHEIFNIKGDACIMNSAFMRDNFFNKGPLKEEKLPLAIEKLGACRGTEQKN